MKKTEKIRDCIYHECMAKVILEQYIPEKYKNLNLSDKPDLKDYSNNIGIEVTIGDDEDELKELSKWLKREENGEMEIFTPDRHLRFSANINQHPYKDILDIFKRKVKKLNSGVYDVFQENNLFIEVTTYWLNKKEEVDFLLPYFIKENIGNHQYKYVYLFSVNTLHIFNLKDRTYKKMPAINNQQCANQAYELAKTTISKKKGDKKC